MNGFVEKVKKVANDLSTEGKLLFQKGEIIFLFKLFI
jgi:hypothetical protein